MREEKQRYGLILAVYLLGLLIGGLYVGMISPARTVIQAGFGIDGTLGIWMINVYTLCYAAFVPITAKIADRRGRKQTFAACMGVFCAGSIVCGLSQLVGDVSGSGISGFVVLLVGRVVQAIGAGGIIPVANAQIGITFPPERRGLALGLAATVMGVANVFGAVVGSAIISAFGVQNWSAMFYLCVPFCVLVIVGAKFALPASDVEPTKARMDVVGSVLLVSFVLLLLLGVKGIDFTNVASLGSPLVWGPIVGAVVLLAVFRQVEHKVADPVLHIEYFHRRPLVVTMFVTFFVGAFTMAMVMVPELVEFTLDMPLGTGGFYVFAMGLPSFVMAPLAGKLLDRFGAKRVLGSGLVVCMAGLAILALIALPAPSPASMIVGLVVLGSGMGLSMGAPTNYMVLENTTPEEGASAIGTITLVRHIGISIAPALFAGLVASTAGAAGYANMLLCVVVLNACAFAALMFYESPKDRS